MSTESIRPPEVIHSTLSAYYTQLVTLETYLKYSLLPEDFRTVLGDEISGSLLELIRGAIVGLDRGEEVPKEQEATWKRGCIFVDQQEVHRNAKYVKDGDGSDSAVLLSRLWTKP
jgi:hypothetical protein